MRYLLFVCVDPAADTYRPEEHNVEDWVAEMDQLARFGRLEIRPFWSEE